MAYRNKTYIAFDADNDIHYYRLMQAWKSSDHIDFDFHNAHELNNLRPSSSEATIKDKLRERLINTKLMIVLIGDNTKREHKFVRWEIEQAIKLGIPLAGVNLNGKRQMDNDLTPPIMKPELAIYLTFNLGMVRNCVDTWPARWRQGKKDDEKGAFYYPDDTYKAKACDR